MSSRSSGPKEVIRPRSSTTLTPLNPLGLGRCIPDDSVLRVGRIWKLSEIRERLWRSIEAMLKQCRVHTVLQVKSVAFSQSERLTEISSGQARPASAAPGQYANESGLPGMHSTPGTSIGGLTNTSIRYLTRVKSTFMTRFKHNFANGLRSQIPPHRQMGCRKSAKVWRTGMSRFSNR